MSEFYELVGANRGASVCVMLMVGLWCSGCDSSRRNFDATAPMDAGPQTDVGGDVNDGGTVIEPDVAVMDVVGTDTPGMESVVLLSPSVQITDGVSSGCNAVSGPGIRCPTYRITFGLQNGHSARDVDQVTEIALDFGDGVALTSSNACNEAPWRIPAGGMSSVIEVWFRYTDNRVEGTGDRASLLFACGDDENGLIMSPSWPPGPESGEVQLRIDGLLSDATPWHVEARIAF